MASTAELLLMLKARDEISSALGGAHKAVSGFGSSLKGIGQVAAGVFAAGAVTAGIGKLTAGISESIGAARESIQVNAQLDAVLKSTGGAAGVTAQSATDLASALEKTSLFEDEAVLSGENLLLTFTNIGKDVFPDATESMVDMSQALGQDMKSSAIQLGKALNDPIQGVTALRRVGVSFTEQQMKQIEAMQKSGDLAGAQKLILAELKKEFGGSAKAASDAAGASERYRDRMNALKEEIGAKLIPVQQKLAEVKLKLVDVIATHLLPAVERLVGWIGPRLSAAFNDARAAVQSIHDAIAPLVHLFLVGLSGGQIGGEFSAIERAAFTLGSVVREQVIPVIEAIIGFMRDNRQVLLVFAAAVGIVTAALITLGVAMFIVGGAIAIITSPITLVILALAALGTAVFFAIKHWDDIKAAISSAWETIKAVLSEWGPFLLLLLGPLGVLLAAFLTNFGGIRDFVIGVVTTVIGVINALPGAFSSVVGAVSGAAGAVIGALSSIPGAVGSVAGAVAGAFGSMAGAVGGAVGSIVGAVSSGFSSVVGAIGGAMGAVVGAVGGAFGQVVGIASGAISQVVGTISGGFSQIVGLVGGAMRAVAGAVAGGFREVVGAAAAGVSEVVRAVGGLAGQLAGPIRGATSVVVEGLRGAFSAARNAVAGLIDEIVGIVAGLPGRLAGPIRSAVGAVRDAVNEIKNKLAEIGGAIGLQHGGFIRRGQVSVVGERGPEIFVPTSDGVVLPNIFFRALANRLGAAPGMSTAAVNITIGTVSLPGVQDVRAFIREISRLQERELRFAARGV